MRNLLSIAVIFSLFSISAFAETFERSFVVTCSETILPSGQSIVMDANYTFRDPVNDPSVMLVVPFTRYQTRILFHLDFTQGGESRIDLKLNEENLAGDLATASSVLHLDGRDIVELVYHTSKPDITGVKASCAVKPKK